MSGSDGSLIDEKAIQDKVQQAHDAVAKNSAALSAARAESSGSSSSSPSSSSSSDAPAASSSASAPAPAPTPAPQAKPATPAPPIPPAAPTLPIKTPAKPKSKSKKKGIEIIMSKLSLFSIALSLIFFGALTFLGGFFIGAWFAGPSTTHPMYGAPMTHPMYGGYPVQHTGAVQYPTGVAQHPSGFRQDIPSDYGQKAGYAVQAGLSSVEVPGVPSILHPFVQATRDAIGAGVGKEVQHGISNVQQGHPAAGGAPGYAPHQSAPATVPHHAAPSSQHHMSIPGLSYLEHTLHDSKSQASLDKQLAQAHGASKKKRIMSSNLGYLLHRKTHKLLLVTCKI